MQLFYSQLQQIFRNFFYMGNDFHVFLEMFVVCKDL